MIKKRISILLAAAMLVNCFTLCRVFAEEARENIAVFDYSAGTASDGISGGSAQEGYCATGGINKDAARLFASVNGNSYTEMGWSGDGNNFYTYNGGSSVSVPVMAASDSTPWGEKPYFLVKTSTKNFDNIKFSARISGTKKGPRDFCLAYSTDNVTFTNIPDSSVKLGLTMETTYANFKLHDEISDKEQVYIKIKIDGSKNTGGANLSDTPSNGHTQINAVEVCGLPITELEAEYNMTQVEFGGRLEGAEISADSKVLRDIAGAGVITAWKGTAWSGASSVTVSATICEEDVNRTAKKSFALPADIDAEAIFYVLADRDDIISMKYKVN